ncbi:MULTISPECIES: cytochrome ubiquinol oxidase subunit I [Desulfovibrio]|uniref:Cytochrome bd-I ubiquinol oxidase subunit 1 apoprotein n=3 Tax=Desulfovibrio TaxID=872 RepID=A0AA94HRC0_DESDE|nr:MULTISPECIES: cytochrome ubiquinol oxidase subunit I [Desulfovibrio]ATD80172.1 cytochrome ubiquinol oxidase subunit I [Desulfovibrio sp. G11]SFW25520.1 cytochrome bd-I ubiquinol oxidase subunit 1 apoprotein [Desulfovibrio desulfuricans]SPD35634.1 Cytochrome bd terminal oxidase, subunit I [Desulfovibrio sp. G11]
MDVVMLSRLQFAVAVFFHFVFVPLTLGLSVIIAWMETRYVRTGDEFWKKQTKFWGKLFVINFTLGVVTGITLEFQFGTNWSRYSEYVGDIFGSLLAIEATVAFFLESTFLAVWHFGWNRVGKKLHLASIWLVAIAGNISALWIILANGFMQNPVGYYINEANNRAELSSFYDVVTNPYAWGMYAHTVIASWALGGFFVLGVSAWHLLRKSNTEFFSRSFRMVAPFTLIFVLLLALSGDQQGKTVAKYQPAKLAAMEAHWETQSDVPFYLLVWPDPENETNTVQALGIPGLLSWIAFDDVHAEVKGLKAFAKEDRPPVLPVFLTFRTMVALAGIFLVLSAWAFFQRKKENPNPLLLRLLVYNIPLPYIGLMVGWAVTEIGRQPWIVYNLMRTTDAVSPIPADNVVISLVAFIGVYSLLGILDIYLLRKFAIKGPDAQEV